MSPSIVESNYLMPDGTKILIRPAQAEDLPGMEWDGEFSHFRRLYKQHFHNTITGSTRMWVAQSETGEIIGQVFLMLYSRQHELADGIDRAYLFSFRLKPDYRNHGLGSFMLEFIEIYLLSRGFKALRLNVARANDQARHMYEKHGFRILGSEEGRWGYEDQFGRWQTVHEPAWRMIKYLKD